MFARSRNRGGAGGIPSVGSQSLGLCQPVAPELFLFFFPLGKKLGFTIDNGKLHNVSLGQGQEVVAEHALDMAAEKGHWVILQVRAQPPGRGFAWSGASAWGLKGSGSWGSGHKWAGGAHTEVSSARASQVAWGIKLPGDSVDSRVRETWASC